MPQPQPLPVKPQTTTPQPLAVKPHARTDAEAAGDPSTPTQPDVPARFGQPLEQTVPVQWQPLLAPALPPAAPEAVPTTTDTALRERLLDTVQQLMVSVPAGPGAQVAPQVRMVLHDSVLPGTTVSVQQVGAQLQVSFECTAHASRQRLDRCAPAFAQSLARRLGREVLVQLHDDTGGALPPVHARAGTSEASL